MCLTRLLEEAVVPVPQVGNTNTVNAHVSSASHMLLLQERKGLPFPLGSSNILSQRR